MKVLKLELSDHLYDKTKLYADDREIPVVGAIRLILSEFHRNKVNAMSKNLEMPEGVIDLGEGKGLAFDMDKFRDKKGVQHIPPTQLPKEQLLDWARNFQNSKKADA